MITGDSKHFVSSIRVIVCLVLILLNAKVYTQNEETDSLLHIVAKGKEDSLKVNALISLAMINAETSPDKALDYAANAKDLAIKIDFKSGEAYACKWLGIIYNNKGNYFQALV